MRPEGLPDRRCRDMPGRLSVHQTDRPIRWNAVPMFESSRIALRRQPAAISVAAPLRLSGLAPGPWDRPWDHPGDRPGERPGDRPEDRPGERAKRVVDILVASLLLLLLGVPMLMIALLVRLDSCGPALF